MKFQGLYYIETEGMEFQNCTFQVSYKKGIG